MSKPHRRRRLHERVYPRRACVGWARRPGEPLRRARVVDQSASGVGLALEGDDPPHMGERVRIVAPGEIYPRSARVVRVASSAHGTTIVGCRWISSAEVGGVRKAWPRPRRLRRLPPRRRHVGDAL